MPELTEQTKKSLDAFRIKELQKSKGIKEFGYKVARIGSKGGKNLNQSAAETGRQILKSLAVNLLDKLEEGEIKFSKEVVSVLKGAVRGELDNKNFEQMKWATEQGLKCGVLGGYAPEKKQSVNLNLNTELKNSKQSRDLIDEYEQKLQNMLKEPKNEP